MKSLSIAVLLLLPTVAVAQTAPAPTPGPSSAPAAAAAAKFTLDTPIQDIVADTQGKAILDKDLPGLTSLPQYDMFKALSLKQVQAYSEGKLTDDMLTKTAADLAAIK